MMIQEISPHSFHIEYVHREPANTDFVLCFRPDQILLRMTGENTFTFPTVEEFNSLLSSSDTTNFQYLFAIDQTGFYLPAGQNVEESYNFCYKSIRDLRRMSPMWKAYAGATGFRLSIWYENNQFCGKCGKAMIHSQRERAMVCPNCKNTVYPAIAPSVIIAVKNGNKLLLTKYQASHYVSRNYALVAGYVETGETVEDTVRREVMEEVGLKVKNLKYYKCQPWPFSGALLFGFFCDLDGDDTISLEVNELSEALWMEREDLPDRSADVSLTSEMMEQFRLGYE